MSIAAIADLPSRFGDFHVVSYDSNLDDKEHAAFVHGDVCEKENVPLRVHSECLTGDALYSMRCDCGYQLEEALRSIAREGRGILMYLRQEGRGIGLLNKIRAYNLQDQGADTVEANEQLGFAADLRDYSMCRDMLAHLGIRSLRLMTNNPRKVDALTDLGIEIAERVPLHVGRNPHNEHYLNTKQSKLGHWFETHQDDDPAV